MDIEAVRRDFPALSQYTWFQNGGVSITPEPVAREHARLMRELFERGPLHIVYPQEEYPRRQASMEKLARFFSVAAAELALMRGVSEAFQTVLRGLPWRAGDRILISGEEEAALLLPVLHLRDQLGVEVDKFPLLADADEQQEAVAARLGARTRLLAFSHVTTDLGFRMPAARLCALARERGVLSFVDLAHSAGLWPMDLGAMGCDFAGALSYKWMYAPYAAGFLYVRAERLGALQVRYAGGRAEAWLDFEADRYALKETAGRFQYGPWSWPLVHAWAASLEYLQRIGLEAVWARTRALTERLKAGLEQVPGAALYTPQAAERGAALVSFGLQGWKGAELAQALRERHNMVVKALPWGREGLRVSLAFFLREAEVDALLAALGELAKERWNR